MYRYNNFCVYFTYLPRSPLGQIYIIFLHEGSSSRRNQPRQKFYLNQIRGFDSVEVKLLAFPYEREVAVNTWLELPFSLWWHKTQQQYAAKRWVERRLFVRNTSPDWLMSFVVMLAPTPQLDWFDSMSFGDALPGIDPAAHTYTPVTHETLIYTCTTSIQCWYYTQWVIDPVL